MNSLNLLCIKYISLVLLFLYVLCTSGCLNDDSDCMVDCSADDLPKITMEGKNTFGCPVEGKVWIAQGGGIGVINPEGALDYLNDYVSVGAINKEQIENINSMNITFCGVNSSLRNCDIIRLAHDPSCGEYVLDETSESRFDIIKFDTSELIFAGEFSFDAIGIGCQDTIEVRNGRFDVKLRKL